MSLLSIVMPLYNTDANMLRASIESVINQSFKDYELIIVCDKPTDGSDFIAKEYAEKDTRIIVLENTVNSGVAFSLNKGIAKASSEYIGRMDADDICHSERFQKQMDYLEKHQDIDVLFTQTQLIDIRGNHLKKRSKHITDDIIVSTFFVGCLVCHPTVVFRKSVVSPLPYIFNAKRKAEDYDLWTRLVIKKAKFSQLPEILYYYRIHGSQVTQKNRQSLDDDALTILHTLLTNDGIECDKEMTLCYQKLMTSIDHVTRKEQETGDKILRDIIDKGIIKVNSRYLQKRKIIMSIRRLIRV